MRAQYKFLLLSLFTVTIMLGFTNSSRAQTNVPGISGSLGTITTCADVRSTGPSGITGGNAGFTGGPGGSFSTTGGQNFPFNPSEFTTSSECAGVSITGTPTDITWPDFDYEDDPDLDEEENEEARIVWYQLSTKDRTSMIDPGTGVNKTYVRGRAGKMNPLFMNEQGICRKIDNTTGSLEPVFVDASDYTVWESVHGVPAGGDPNGGFSRVANRADLPSVAVCCSPVTVNICGRPATTEYAEVGDVVSVYTGGGYAELRCASNNNFTTLSVIGICNGGGGGGGPSGGSGYSNPNNGGTISQSQMDSMSPAAQQDLADQGYAATDNVSTNAQGAADAAAAAEAAQDAAEAEAEAEAAAAAAAEAQAEADRQAAQDAEDAANDDDD